MRIKRRGGARSRASLAKHRRPIDYEGEKCKNTKEIGRRKRHEKRSELMKYFARRSSASPGRWSLPDLRIEDGRCSYSDGCAMRMKRKVAAMRATRRSKVTVEVRGEASAGRRMTRQASACACASFVIQTNRISGRDASRDGAARSR